MGKEGKRSFYECSELTQGDIIQRYINLGYVKGGWQPGSAIGDKMILYRRECFCTILGNLAWLPFCPLPVPQCLTFPIASRGGGGHALTFKVF